MEHEQLKHALYKITPTVEQKERMLNLIIDKRENAKRSLGKKVNRATQMVLATSFVLLISFMVYKAIDGQVTFQGKDDLPKIERFNLQGYSPSRGGGIVYYRELVYDRSELMMISPWRENMNITQMPVYENMFAGLNYEERVAFIAEEEKEKRAKEIADALGVSIIKKEPFNSDGSDYTYICDNDVKIYIGYDLYAVVYPLVIDIPHFDVDDPYENELHILEDFYYKYETLFGFTQPEFKLYETYNVQGERFYEFRYVYEGAAESDAEKITNFDFTRAYIGISRELGQGGVQLSSPLKYKEVGEYPIISKDDATAKLLAGEYLTTDPNDKQITEADIAKVEFTYFQSPSTKYFQPVYIFYIEIEELTLENGLIDYGKYFVPAVEEQYLDIVLDELNYK